jgi:hypothetical protein
MARALWLLRRYAQDDWAEWIEPWNWTFRYQSSSGESLQLETSPRCAPPPTVLSLLWIENPAEIGAMVLDLIASWIFTMRGPGGWPNLLCFPGKGKFSDTLVMALGTLSFWIAAGVAGAVTAHNTSGYSEFPTLDYFFLHCTHSTLTRITTSIKSISVSGPEYT